MSAADDDEFESNDIIGGARKLNSSVYTDLLALDEDWFYVSLEIGQHVDVKIEFNHSISDLILQITNNDSVVRDESNTSTALNGVESCSYSPTVGSEEFYNQYNDNWHIYILVNTTDNWGANYNISVVIDDAFESNNDLNSAYEIEENEFQVDHCVANEDDFYSIEVPAAYSILARLQYKFYDTSGGNLTFHLLDDAGIILETADKIPLGSTGIVQIRYDTEPPLNRTYYVQVDTIFGTNDDYNIRIAYGAPDDDYLEYEDGGNDVVENATKMMDGFVNCVQNDVDWYYKDNMVEEGRTTQHIFAFTLDGLVSTEFIQIDIIAANQTILKTHTSTSELNFNVTVDFVGPDTEKFYIKITGSNWGLKYNVTHSAKDIFESDDDDDDDGFNIPGFSIVPFGLTSLFSFAVILIRKKKE